MSSCCYMGPKLRLSWRLLLGNRMLTVTEWYPPRSCIPDIRNQHYCQQDYQLPSSFFCDFSSTSFQVLGMWHEWIPSRITTESPASTLLQPPIQWSRLCGRHIPTADGWLMLCDVQSVKTSAWKKGQRPYTMVTQQSSSGTWLNRWKRFRNGAHIIIMTHVIIEHLYASI